jgi:glycosyltransferase involved in cell wall biosynthesis
MRGRAVEPRRESEDRDNPVRAVGDVPAVRDAQRTDARGHGAREEVQQHEIGDVEEARQQIGCTRETDRAAGVSEEERPERVDMGLGRKHPAFVIQRDRGYQAFAAHHMPRELVVVARVDAVRRVAGAFRETENRQRPDDHGRPAHRVCAPVLQSRPPPPDRIIGILARRFLFVLEYFPPHIGGVEVLFGELAAELVRRGHAVEVITSADPGEARHEVRGGITIHRIAAPAFARRYLFMLMAIPRAIRAARRADLVHTTTYNAAIPAWIAARLARRPVVITAHEVFGRQWQEMPGMNRLLGWGYRVFESIVLRLGYAHVITPSEFTRKRLPDPARATTIYNAVDHEFWSPGRHRARDLKLPEGTFVYLYFGRPGVSKGVEHLLDAAERVRREVPRSRLVMILSREPERQYRRVRPVIDALGEHVLLMDSLPREELPSWLLAADCVVVPSLSEGFGYSAVEAAALGCRVIATSGHATEELLHGVAKFVPSRDVNALAQAIIDASREREPAVALLRRFTAEEHARSVVDVYRRVGVDA